MFCIHFKFEHYIQKLFLQFEFYDYTFCFNKLPYFLHFLIIFKNLRFFMPMVLTLSYFKLFPINFRDLSLSESKSMYPNVVLDKRNLNLMVGCRQILIFQVFVLIVTDPI